MKIPIGIDSRVVKGDDGWHVELWGGDALVYIAVACIALRLAIEWAFS